MMAGRTSFQAPVVDGVLLARRGLVHRNRGVMAECGTHLPDRRVAVSALQAQVHKLPVCTACYPPLNTRKGVSR